MNGINSLASGIKNRLIEIVKSPIGTIRWGFLTTRRHSSFSKLCAYLKNEFINAR
jgi:hypothetical protein